MIHLRPHRRLLLAAGIALAALALAACWLLLAPLSSQSDTQYIYIDTDDTADSVYARLRPVASPLGLATFRRMASCSGYARHIRTGRYAVSPTISAFRLLRRLKSGMQAPVSLTVPSVRTREDLCQALARKLMADSVALLRALQDSATCAHYGYTPETIVCMFVPNTYDIYWNTTPAALLQRMQRESRHFWNTRRTAQAAALELTPVEVMTLASIVDEETADNGEKPMIAGMYYNRLRYRDAEYPEGMPLQADPTIKFALGDFALKRIYHGMLLTDSPYNTYKHAGLPPGPIRIPSVAGIDAVLGMTRHDYLYMCAREDFSGTHRFARTYSEHLHNAALYAKALNERGIN